MTIRTPQCFGVLSETVELAGVMFRGSVVLNTGESVYLEHTKYPI